MKVNINNRTIVYIDGYNLYYGMRCAFGNRYKWLNLEKFSESLLVVGTWFAIGKRKFKLSQLPGKISTKSGNTISCPDKWRQ